MEEGADLEFVRVLPSYLDRDEPAWRKSFINFITDSMVHVSSSEMSVCVSLTEREDSCCA